MKRYLLCIALLSAVLLTGCLGARRTQEIRHEDGTVEKHVFQDHVVPGTDIVLWTTEDGHPTLGGIFDFLPSPWGKVATVALGVATLFGPPRMRENSVGAIKAVGNGKIKRAALHLAALTPLVRTPKGPA